MVNLTQYFNVIRIKAMLNCPRNYKGNYIRDKTTSESYEMDGQAGDFTNEDITPEMLSAGVEAACLFNPSDDCFEVMLPTIYRAMLAAARPVSPPQTDKAH